MPRLNVLLRPETADMLRRPIRGDGGFQSLMRRIQLGLRGRMLLVEDADVDALLRATRGKHIGGFQRRARDIVVDAVVDQLRVKGFKMREDPDAIAGTVTRLDEWQPHLPFGGDR